MGAITIALLVAFVIGAVLGVYALLAPRRNAEPQPVEAPRPELHVETAVWGEAAAAEFDALAEPARCDMIFAVSALDDQRSAQLLEHALDDTSETVALAAARALRERGRTDAVDEYLARHPGQRADRIAHTLSLLAPP
jgi:hypothetical protein